MTEAILWAQADFNLTEEEANNIRNSVSDLDLDLPFILTSEGIELTALNKDEAEELIVELEDALDRLPEEEAEELEGVA